MCNQCMPERNRHTTNAAWRQMANTTKLGTDPFPTTPFTFQVCACEFMQAYEPILPIPKGLRPPAQGCEERATLGQRNKYHQPQRGCAGFPGRSNHQRDSVEDTTHFGVDVKSTSVTQGSSFLATLGFGAESLWDSQSSSAPTRGGATNNIYERTGPG
jgi:hypothetical protein